MYVTAAFSVLVWGAFTKEIRTRCNLAHESFPKKLRRISALLYLDLWKSIEAKGERASTAWAVCCCSNDVYLSIKSTQRFQNEAHKQNLLIPWSSPAKNMKFGVI